MNYCDRRQYSIPPPASADITSEKQFREELARWQEWSTACTYTTEGQEHHPRFYLQYGGDDRRIDDTLRRHRKSKRARKETVQVRATYYFVLAAHGNGLVKYTRRGFKYAYTEADGKAFRTEKEAAARLAALQARNAYKADTWQVKRIDRPCTFHVVGKAEPAETE